MAGKITIKKLTEYFVFLDNLRESGATNMYGAGPYVEEAFGLARREATPIVSRWMKTFDGSSPPKERAIKALAEGPAP